MSLIESAMTILLILLGLGSFAWYMGRMRTEVRWAHRRAADAGRSARLRLEQLVAAERLRVAEEAARRMALDEFLTALHAKERAHVRERRLGEERKRSVVVEERLYFGNLPISTWTAQELTYYPAAGAADSPKLLPREAV